METQPLILYHVICTVGGGIMVEAVTAEPLDCEGVILYRLIQDNAHGEYLRDAQLDFLLPAPTTAETWKNPANALYEMFSKTHDGLIARFKEAIILHNDERLRKISAETAHRQKLLAYIALVSCSAQGKPN